MKANILLMHAIDKKFFGDGCKANKYLGTIILGLVVLLGAVCSTSTLLGSIFSVRDLFGFGNLTTFWSYAPFTSIPAAALILESCLCCDTQGKKIGRSLLVLVLTAVMYLAGFFAAIVVYCLLLLWIIYAIIMLAVGRPKRSDDKASKGEFAEAEEVAEDKGQLPSAKD